MVRFAHAHGLRVESMCTTIFGYRSPIWNRDIDRSMPGPMLELLSEASGVSIQRLEGCLLTSFAGILTEGVNVRGFSGGVLPLGVYHRKRTRHSLMFCPECLRTDDYPYFRKNWRVSFVTVCLQHRVELLDRCPECSAQIVPHRVDMKWRYQTTTRSLLHVLCHSCGSDLRQSKGVAAASEDLIAGAWVAAALEDGWVRLGDNMVHALAFFAGLAALIRGVNARRKEHRGFDLTPIKGRRLLLREACSLLEDWPDRFLNFASDKDWTTATLLNVNKPLPFWLHRVVKLHLDREHAPISQEEAIAILNQVAKTGRPQSFARAKQISGRMIEKRHVPPEPDARIDDEIFSMLLAHIDHRVSQTWNKRERAHLLADKVIFGLTRIYGFSQARIVTLSLTDVRDIANDNEPDFWTTPTSKTDVGAWVGWYLRSVRPLLIPAEETTSLFVSRVGGRPLTANAIGERFAGYCQRAFLRRQIRNYQVLVRTTHSG